MNQGDIDENELVKNTTHSGSRPETPQGRGIKTLIPAVNDDPLKEVTRWAKKVYHQTRLKVHWRQLEKIKGIMPIEMADYAVRKTFGNWRLTAPTRDGEKSPLQVVIELIQPYIEPAKWDLFRRGFVRLLKITFTAICESGYDPEMTAAMNEWLNDFIEGRRGPPVGRHGRQEGLVRAYLAGGVAAPHIEFVLHPETAEDRNSERLFRIRSAIWERFTGQPLDRAQYLTPSGFKQMEMDLVLTPPGPKE